MNRLRIAIAGNPNAGKTTLFNRMTGASAKVANYPGVTIERRAAFTTLPAGTVAECIDLPGCYSLTARSSEEEIAHHVLLGVYGDPLPDRVVCVVDATSLSRGLYLALQLRELGIPMVVALNMSDVARDRNLHVDADTLSQRLGVAVVPTSARLGEGLETLRSTLERTLPPPANNDQECTLPLPKTDLNAVDRFRHELAQQGHPASMGHALWLLTSDIKALRPSLDPSVSAAVTRCRRVLDPDGGGAFNRRIIGARYSEVDRLLSGIMIPHACPHDTTSRRLDRLFLHPVAGTVVFVATMFILFQAVFAWAEPAIGTIEDAMTWLATGLESGLPDGLVQSLLANGIVAGIGNVLVFLPQLAFLFLGITLLEESGYMPRAAFLLDRVMQRVGLHGKSFIPLMSSFACAVPGVMAARTVESSRDRLVTVMVAPFMSCSARLPVYVLVVSAVLGTGPAVFGVFSRGGLAIFAMYSLGFVAAVSTAWLLKRTVLHGPTPTLLMELPPYRWPLWRPVLGRVVARCRVFVVQTGTIIMALSVLMWGLLTFPQNPEVKAHAEAATHELAVLVANGLPQIEADREQQRIAHALAAAQLEHSWGGRIGRLVEPLIAPLGFDWRIGIGLVASFAAREILVTTLGQVYALGAEVEPDSPALRHALLADKDPTTGQPRFTPLVGISLMVFFVLAMQCLSTVATVKRETNSWRWALAQLIYMNTLAYGASFAVYQGGKALGWS